MLHSLFPLQNNTIFPMAEYKLIVINGKAVTVLSNKELGSCDPDPLDRRQHFKFLDNGQIFSKVFPLVLCVNSAHIDSPVTLGKPLPPSTFSSPIVGLEQKWLLTNDQYLVSELSLPGSEHKERYLGLHSNGSGAVVVTCEDATTPIDLVDAPPDVTIHLSNSTAEPVTVYYKSPTGSRIQVGPIPCGNKELNLITSQGARFFFVAGIPLHPSHIKAIDHEHVIIREGPLGKHQVTLQNNTDMNIEVKAVARSSEGEPSIRVFTLAPNAIRTYELESGTKLKATASDSVTEIHPSKKRIDGPETFIYTCDLHLPKIEGDAIRRWLPNKIFTLIYKATKCGFDATHFARYCHRSGPAIAIITSSDGFRFGGYAPDGWGHSMNYWSANPSTFTFSLANPTKSPPIQNVVENPKGTCGYWPGTSRHIAFGANDIFLDTTGTQGYFRSVPDPSSLLIHPGPTAYTGKAHFHVQEIEVYQVRNFHETATLPAF